MQGSGGFTRHRTFLLSIDRSLARIWASVPAPRDSQCCGASCLRADGTACIVQRDPSPEESHARPRLASDEPTETSLTTVYSHSRIASYEKCPKQFHYRYVLEIPSETEGIEAFMGKRVHEVLERLYEFASRGQVPSLEKVLYRFHAFWDEHYDDKRVVVVRKGTPVSHYRNLGVRCLTTYYRNHHPFDQGETLGTEEEVLFDLDDEGAYRIRGVIDRVVRMPDGTIEIQDYKTGRMVPSQAQLDVDRQLALYQLGLRDRFDDDPPMRLVWHFLQRGVVRRSQRSRADLETLRARTVEDIETIRSATDFPIHRSRLCDWCEYKQRCHAEHP